MNIRNLDGALCVSEAAVFDGTSVADIRYALATCARCPALVACHHWAATQTHQMGGGSRRGTGTNGGVIGLQGIVGGRVYGDALKLLRAWQHRRKETRVA